MKRTGLLLVVALLLGSCGPGSNIPEPIAPTAAPAATPIAEIDTPAAGEIVMVGFGAYESEREYFEPLIERFNQEHAGIQVQFVALDEVTRLADDEPYDPDKVMRRTVSAADTLVYRDQRPEDIARGYLHDLKPFMDADASFDRDDFYPGALDRFSRDGGVYLVPQFISIPLLSYNKELWSRKGLLPPKPDWTMQDMLSAAAQIATKRGDTVEVFGTLAFHPQTAFFYELETAGLELLAMSPRQVRLDQPEVIAALERAIDLAEAGAIYAPRPPPEGQPYTDDYQGMIFDQRAGMWSPFTIYWGSRSGDPPFEVGTALWPEPSNQESSPGASGYAISAGTRHPEAAWRWLSFLSKQPPTSNYEWRRPADAGLLPARKSIAEQVGYWKVLDDEAKTAVETALARPVPPLRDSGDGLILIHLHRAIEAVLRGDQNPAQALRAAQAELEQQLAQAQLTPTPASAAGPIVVATPQTAAALPGATTIVFGTPLGFNNDFTRRFAKSFNQEHSDIFVDVKDLNVETLASAAVRSDCFRWFGPPETNEVSATLDLQPLIDADPAFNRDDYPPILLAPFRHGSGLYGLPSSVNVRMLAYNQAAFDAAGRPYPTAAWTLDDLIDAAQKLTSGTGDNRRYGFAADFGHTHDIRLFLNQSGASLVKGSGEAQQPNFTDSTVSQALRAYLDLLRRASPHKRLLGYTQSWGPDAEQLVNQGKVAMWFDYGFGANMLRQRPSELRIAVAPPPLGQRPLTPDDFNMSGLFISATTQHAQACWTWLKALSEDLSGLEGAFPARISIADSQAFRAQALPGAVEVYQAYRAAFSRTPDTAVGIDLNRSPIDFFWFFRAADRALQGADLERELATAQTLTEQHLACVRGGTKASVCAKQVDPQYEGWKSAEQH